MKKAMRRTVPKWLVTEVYNIEGCYEGTGRLNEMGKVKNQRTLRRANTDSVNTRS